MNKIKIKFTKQQLTKDFNMSEFYYAANPDQCYEIEECLIDAAQIIRDWIGFSTIVTSTYRPNDRFGFHKVGKAIDLIPAYTIHGKPSPKSIQEVLKAFKNECMNYIQNKPSKLISDLRAIGIAGFGIENCCIHLDSRDKVFSRKDQYGSYTIFEYEQDKNGKIIKNRSL